jgi:hypothetical protein
MNFKTLEKLRKWAFSRVFAVLEKFINYRKIPYFIIRFFEVFREEFHAVAEKFTFTQQ